ncbi:hypothetical protein DITRI_Ditri15bG0090700 [Diplodiscus trichospermus]
MNRMIQKRNCEKQLRLTKLMKRRRLGASPVEANEMSSMELPWARERTCSSRSKRVEPDGDMGQWRITRFYGEPIIHRKEASWNLLRTLSSQVNLLWKCFGDFNEILYDHEKSGQSLRRSIQMENFRQVVDQYGLNDLGFKGAWFT